MMAGFREKPPQKINRSRVLVIHDYLTGVTRDMVTGEQHEIALPKSNVLQFLLEDGSKISVRPSGTEPKIKFYFSVKEKAESKEAYSDVKRILEERIANLKKDLKLV
jgi:phosphoglucomutase